MKDNMTHITYDILNSDPFDKFIISIHITDANGNRINAEALDGDIGQKREVLPEIFYGKKAIVIVSANDCCACNRIVFGEGKWEMSFSIRVPLKFESVYFSIHLFQVVNFLLLLCAPKIAIAIKTCIGVYL